LGLYESQKIFANAEKSEQKTILLSLFRLDKDPLILEKLEQFAKKELEKSLLELRSLFFGELKSEKKTV